VCEGQFPMSSLAMTVDRGVCMNVRRLASLTTPALLLIMSHVEGKLTAYFIRQPEPSRSHLEASAIMKLIELVVIDFAHSLIVPVASDVGRSVGCGTDT